MDRLVKHYATRLVDAGLASPAHGSGPLVGGLDDELVWNRQGPEIATLERVFADLDINSLVYLRPAEPYRAILRFLADRAGATIRPQDCETRTFLHDLPVIAEFTADAMVDRLKSSKSVIIASSDADGGPAVVAHGTVSPEQGFVVVSSVCFACLVKFFSDYLAALQNGAASAEYHQAFDAVVAHLGTTNPARPQLMTAPFDTQAAVYRAVAQAGRITVAQGLVDSCFGNLSYRWGGILYISQTGSSLDALEGCVDPVPLDGSTSAGLTASSELDTHLRTVARTGCRAILHGHPRFAVILSLNCPPQVKAACDATAQCHLRCPRPRFIGDIPIVPGEVGSGISGLCHSVPPALENHRGAIVHGHGLFTTGREDFNEALDSMLEVEKMCRQTYFEMVASMRG